MVKVLIKVLFAAGIMLGIIGRADPAEEKPSAMAGYAYYFDMGVTCSPVWAGFTQVAQNTVYNKERGYGWKEPAKNAAYCERNLWFDPLCGDWVGTGKWLGEETTRYDLRGELEFIVDVSNGAWRVWVISGDMDGGGVLTESAIGHVVPSYSISAEGQEKVSFKISKQEAVNSWYYRHVDDIWRKDRDVWAKYVEPRFQTLMFSVTVADGRLNLKFANMPINAIIVYPEARALEGAAFIKELRLKRKNKSKLTRVMKPARWWGLAAAAEAEAQPMAEDKKAGRFEATEAETEKGYLIWTPHYLEDISPEDIPCRELVGNTINAFSAAGEKEPLCFTIYPLRDLTACQVSFDDLVNENGTRLSKNNIDLRMARYFERRGSESRGIAQYYTVEPFFLEKRPVMDMEKEINRQYWLLIDVPENTPPGVYKTAVKFIPSNAPPSEIKVCLEVFPFTLKKIENHHYDLQYHYLTAPPAKDKEALQRRYQSMMECDFDVETFRVCQNGITISQDGAIKVNLSSDDKILRDLKENYGYAPKILISMDTGNNLVSEYLGKKYPSLRYTKEVIKFSPEFDQLFTRVMQELVGEIKKRPEWPEVVFMHGSNEGGGTRAQGFSQNHVHELAKRAGATTYSAFTMFIAVEPTPGLDIPALTPWFCTERILTAIHSLKGKDTRLWGYYIGDDRFERGFFMWRCGIETSIIEGGMILFGDPYNEFDGHYPTWAHVWPTPDGVMPTLWWERAREGVDDMRYLEHLDLLIKKAEKSGKSGLARKAQNTLDSIMREIKPNIMYYRGRGGAWSGTRLDQARWRIARQIIELERDLK